jgi:hypothetical protein
MGQLFDLTQLVAALTTLCVGNDFGLRFDFLPFLLCLDLLARLGFRAGWGSS